MEITVVLVSGLLAALVLWVFKSLGFGRHDSRLKKLSGPWGLPIVGYIPFLTSKPHLALTELAKKYGNVFSIRLGSQNIVILNDFQSTKEAFSQDAFIGRPPNTPFKLNKETEETGAFFGMPWKEQRRFCLHMLRDLGLGRSKMEGFMLDEIEELLAHFEKNVDKPIQVNERLQSSTANNIASLMFGRRFKFDDPQRKRMMQLVNESSQSAGQVVWLIFFPWMKAVINFLPFTDSLDKMAQVTRDLKSFVRKEIDEHAATFNADNIRDFIDTYLLEMKEKRKDDPTFTKSVLEDLAGAFFGAGSDTVRHTLEWLLLVASGYPEYQRRIQSEIREVVGHERLPNWLDHKNMPYTEAFIQEVMRWRTLIPLNLMRYTLVDTELNGFFIPKHTTVLSNHWAIHHDPKLWGPDAEEFRPERFLNEEGTQLKKFESYAPFSVGKRACPGEPMAKVEIFLYFVAILQRFDVRLPEGKVADFEGELGIDLAAKPQDIVLSKRAV